MFEINYQYLRPKKAKSLAEWYGQDFQEREDLSVESVKNGTILPLRKVAEDRLLFGRGGVIDENGSYVSLSSIPNRIQNAYPVDRLTNYRDEKVVYCGYLVHHWGHFLVEAVTRLWYFLENDPTVDKYVFFINEHEQREISGNYKEFLMLLKVWDKLEIINTPTTYREVLIPERAFQIWSYFSPKYLKIFDTIANNVIADPGWVCPEKIYYSRSAFTKGKGFEFGFDTLDNFFQKNDYTILYPEKVPLSQMICYIRNAKVVASLSGSLPHNMLFASSGQRVEILERCVLNNDFQVHINRMRELKATYIDANISLYTVDMCGPFIMGYNTWMQKFAADNGFIPPDPQFTTEKHLRSCFKKYMQAYQDLYRYQWYMDDWYSPYADYLFEAYQEGSEFFADYLNGSKPFCWHHYFEIHYWKQLVKQLLKKMKLYPR